MSFGDMLKAKDFSPEQDEHKQPPPQLLNSRVHDPLEAILGDYMSYLSTVTG